MAEVFEVAGVRSTKVQERVHVREWEGEVYVEIEGIYPRIALSPEAAIVFARQISRAARRTMARTTK